MKTTKLVTLPSFFTSTIRGSTKLRSHGLRLYLIAEPLDSTQLPPSVQCASSYCTLEPGSNRVAVGLRNVLAKAITIPAQTFVGHLQQARMIPSDKTSKLQGKQGPPGGKGLLDFRPTTFGGIR